MTTFMPSNAEKAQAFEHKLSQGIFGSPAKFIEYYNTGLINRKFPEVVDILNELTNVYRNVRKVSGEITFIPTTELYITELQAGIALWSVILELKKAVNGLLSEGVVTHDTVIGFKKDDVGYIYVDGSDDRHSNHLSARWDDFVTIFDKVSSYQGQQNPHKGIASFKVSDFDKLDESFIEQMRALLP